MGLMGFLAATLGLQGKPDKAEQGIVPSPVSMMLAVDKKTDYQAVEFAKHYSGLQKVLVICTEQQYMTMANGAKFSTGNHPVETCQPLRHLVAAGFDFDVATPTGKPVCVEQWAMPEADEAFKRFYHDECKAKLENPKSLAALMDDTYDDDDTSNNNKLLEDYLCVFIPGGHGAMLGLPEDKNVGKLIHLIKEKDGYLISICHGPSAFLAAKSDDGEHPYKGYKIAAFPDFMDRFTPTIGYMPGSMPWFFGQQLREQGLIITNTLADKTVVKDRKLVTGASPQASQAFGVLAAETLLEAFA